MISTNFAIIRDQGKRSGYMKIIKFLYWVAVLVIFASLGVLIYQNQTFFMARTPLDLNLNVQDSWQWTLTGWPTCGYLAFCFALGLLLAGVKAVSIKMKTAKILKERELKIADLMTQIGRLTTDLEVFTHDPYIKKGLQKAPGTLASTEVEAIAPEQEPAAKEDVI